ncbi:MAG: MAPEG family protein [Ferrovibrio sp.]
MLPPFAVTPLYAALCGLLLLVLSLRVVLLRRRRRVKFGDGGHDDLQRAVRAQGNFTEYAPLLLFMLFLLELSRQPVWALHLLGVMILLGRVIHAITLSRHPATFRTPGMALTFVSLLVLSLWLLVVVAQRLLQMPA